MTRDVIFIFGGLSVFATHLSEELVIRSGCVHGSPSYARVSGLVEGVVSHHGTSMEVGRQDEVVVLHPLDDGQCLWFHLRMSIRETDCMLE